MFVDEKIAQLERYRRQTLREEEKQAETEGEPAALLTLEEALEGIENGRILLREGTELTFEKRIYFEREIPVTLFEHFYRDFEETGESAVFVNHDHEISQVFSWLRENTKAITMKQWENLIVNGMAANGLFARVVKREQLHHLEYLCYEVPSGKGWVYNLMFRMRGREKRFTGNFNCMKQEAGSYGVLLEAMIVNLDQWFETQTGGADSCGN